ncbi:MAG: hypothetical protein J5882_08140 [Bacteroidales bacterium]|nr:hypothetical protein [Bacteroidales bacterium]
MYFKRRTSNASNYEEYQVTVSSDGRITDFLKTNFPLTARGGEITSGPVYNNIMHFVELLATAHSSKNLEFLKMIYSDYAIIITGYSIKPNNTVVLNNSDIVRLDDHFRYEQKSKAQYIQKLSEVFQNNAFISVNYLDISICTHPTKNEKYKDIYYVRMKQIYRSSSYNDEGYLTLVWSFKNPESPEILVRAWFDKEFDMRRYNLNLPTN